MDNYRFPTGNHVWDDVSDNAFGWGVVMFFQFSEIENPYKSCRTGFRLSKPDFVHYFDNVA